MQQMRGRMQSDVPAATLRISSAMEADVALNVRMCDENAGLTLSELMRMFPPIVTLTVVSEECIGLGIKTILCQL